MPVKMWQGWSSVQTRLTLVMLAAGTFAALMLVVSGKSETRRMDAYLAADAKEDGELLDRTLELEGGSLATFAKDYTNWGEMVRFVETGDRTWASVNIDDVLATYRADAAWVFDAAGSPVYAVRDSTLEALLEPLPPGLSVKDEFGDDHFCHFFIAGPDGPVEIRGATIHPSEDDERKTPVRGYFLAARSWNRQYLAELTRLTRKTIRVEFARAGAKPSAEIARQLGEIKFTRPLPGPEGKPELMLTALSRPEWIAMARRSSSDLSVQMAALALLAVMGLTLVLWLWVTRPLGQIRRSLESGTAETLKPLERSRTEFGQLAQLVDQSFGQNAALVKEVTERKQAEQTLRESKERYRETVDALPEAVFEAGPDGRLTLVNRSGLAAFGLDEADIARGVNVFQLLVPEDRERAAADARRVMGGESRPGTEYTALRKDGSRFPAIVHADRIIRDGQPVGLRGILIDISVRKLTEQTLRESEEKYRLVVDNADEAILVAQDGKLVFTNPRTNELLGYPREGLFGRSITDFIHPDDRALVADRYRRRIAGEDSPVGYEFRIVRRDGETRHVEINATRIEWMGRPATLNFLADITERRQAEQALRESEKRFHDVALCSADWVWEVDAQGRYTFCSEHVLHVLGYEPGELLGRTPFDLMTEDERARIAPAFAALLAERKPLVDLENRNLTKDGSEVVLLTNGVPMLDGNGNLLGYRGVDKDVTERRRAEGEAKRHAELQTAINEMLRVSFEDLPLDSILEKSLGIITAIPWLVLDSRGSIHLVEDDPEVLVMKAQRGLANSLLVMCNRVRFGRCLCGRAASTRQLVFADHVDDSHENRYDGIRDHGHYCVPMLSADQRVLGVLNLYIMAGGKKNKETEQLLGVIANVLAGVVQRKRTEEALRTSKAQLSNAMEIAKLGYWEYDVVDDLFTFNDHFYGIFRTTAEKVGGYKMKSAEYARRFVHPDDVAVVGAETLKAIKTTDPHFSQQLEHRIIYADGSVGYVSVRFFVVKDSQGRTVKTFGANQDITERKRAEVELRESELKFRAIFDSASDGMFLVDSESRKFFLANSSCLRMLGYSADEFVNLSMADLHPAEDLPFIFRQIESFAKGELGKPADFRYKRRDGSEFPADSNPARMTLGGKEYIIIMFRDITERKQAQAELAMHRDHLEGLVHTRTAALELANKELETFSYSVSHDLRAPLRAINGFARALQEDCADQLDTVGLDYLDRVRAASRHMAKLIDDLLDLSRIARLPLVRKLVDLTGLARTIAGELHSAEPARQVELVIPDGMTAQADPVLAEMVLRNLLNNAWKFTGKHPTARIEVGETLRDGEPVWFVRDDGAGFDMAYVGNLSKPFQRLHGPADFPGTGIGHVTVQRIVRRHDGRGWIEGAVEKGATYYFTF